MSAIFGTVTAEVSDELVTKFPDDFDFYSMALQVSKDAGVMLLITDQHYKFQGLWISMRKVYDSLSKTLATYASKSLSETACIETTTTYNSAENGKPKNTNAKRISNKETNFSAPEVKLIPVNGILKSKTPRDERKVQEGKSSNCSAETNPLLSEEPLKDRMPNSLEDPCKKEQIKNGSTIIPPKRKRGRPKKTLISSLSVVKPKMYKFTKLRSNFVSRTSQKQPERKSDISDKLTDRMKKTSSNKTMSQEKESQPNSPFDTDLNDQENIQDDTLPDLNALYDEEDIYQNVEKTEKRVKKKRGRPRLPVISKTFACSRCDFICESANSLSDHRQTVHKQCPAKCDICLKIFPNKRYMVRHRVCHVEPQHCCDLCGKMYKVKKSMEEHRKTHDDDYTKPVVDCPQCSKQFCNNYILKCHIKSEHLGEKKSFLCSVCGKSFTTKHSLQEHSNAHKGLKPHICDVCGKGFNYESALRDHKYTHTESRRFSCTICKKHFCQRSGLKMHMQIHAVEKKFICEDCGRGFTQKQALERHERVHKGFKPFTCKLCHRTFTDSSIIRRHLILVHKIHKDSSSWREDIISKINPTNFRVEKVDPAKSDDKKPKGEQKQEEVNTLPLYHSNSMYNYQTKLELTSYESGPVSQLANSQGATNDNQVQDFTKIGMPQALDYSERGTLNVNAEHIDQQNASDRHHSQLSHSTWEISNSQCNPDHNGLSHLHPSDQQHNMAADPMHLSKDYPQTAHLLQSVNNQYLHSEELVNEPRCNSVNYPHDIRPVENSVDPTTSSSQWTSIYAYYSQLASQFGMNFNDYQQTLGYPIQESLQNPSQPNN